MARRPAARCSPVGYRQQGEGQQGQRQRWERQLVPEVAGHPDHGQEQGGGHGDDHAAGRGQPREPQRQRHHPEDGEGRGPRRHRVGEPAATDGPEIWGCAPAANASPPATIATARVRLSSCTRDTGVATSPPDRAKQCVHREQAHHGVPELEHTQDLVHGPTGGNGRLDHRPAGDSALDRGQHVHPPHSNAVTPHLGQLGDLVHDGAIRVGRRVQGEVDVVPGHRTQQDGTQEHQPQNDRTDDRGGEGQSSHAADRKWLCCIPTSGSHKVGDPRRRPCSQGHGTRC